MAGTNPSGDHWVFATNIQKIIMLLYHVFFRDAPGWSTSQRSHLIWWSPEGFLWYIHFLRVAPNAEIQWSCPPGGHQFVKIKVGATQLTQLLGKYVAIYYHLRQLPGWTNLHFFMLKPHVSWWILRFGSFISGDFPSRIWLPGVSKNLPWFSMKFPWFSK